MPLKCYFIPDPSEDDGSGIAVIASISNEAKKIGYKEYGADWIDIKPKWQRDVNTEGLKPGILGEEEGSRRRAYSWIEGTCPKCGNVDRLEFTDGLIACADCRDARECREEGA